MRRLDILRTLLNKFDKFDILQESRRNLALVQHRKPILIYFFNILNLDDAITGTSKPHVMSDYLKRLIAAEKAFDQLEAEVLGDLNYVNFANGKTLEFDSKTQK